MEWTKRHDGDYSTFSDHGTLFRILRIGKRWRVSEYRYPTWTFLEYAKTLEKGKKAVEELIKERELREN